VTHAGCAFDPTPLTGQTGFASRGHQNTCITSTCQFQHHKVICCQNTGLSEESYTPAYAPKDVCSEVSYFSPWGTVAICMAISLAISLGVVGFNMYSKFRRHGQAKLQLIDLDDEEEEEEEEEEEDYLGFTNEHDLFDPTHIEVTTVAELSAKHRSYGAISEASSLLAVPSVQLDYNSEGSTIARSPGISVGRPQRKRNFSDIKFTPPQDLTGSIDFDHYVSSGDEHIDSDGYLSATTIQ
jgi:hypothetical protein